MSIITVASICPLLHPAQPERNLGNVRRWAEAAAAAGAQLALFPELYVTGYMADEMDAWPAARQEAFRALAEPVPGPGTDRLVAWSRALGVHLCAGMLERDGAALYNTQVLVAPAEGLLGRYRKVHVAEREAWFSQPGDDFPVFDVEGVSTGIMICRDKSFPEAARILALDGAQLLLNPHSFLGAAAQPFTDWSLRLCVGRAMENGCYLVANNNVFDHPDVTDRQAGHTFAIDPYGKVVALSTGPGHLESLTLVRIDTDVVRERRASEGVHFNLWSRRPEAYGRLVRGG